MEDLWNEVASLRTAIAFVTKRQYAQLALGELALSDLHRLASWSSRNYGQVARLAHDR